MTRYDVYYESKPIGFVQVEPVGLYTHYRCRCSFRENGLYRIVAKYGKLCIDLGICIPEHDEFVAYARVPTKNLNEASPCFYAIERNRHKKEFIPVDTRHEFAFITQLVKAKYYVMNDVRGILIENDQRDSFGEISSK